MFSERIVKSLASGSMIRAMFEQGNALKKLYGPENVYDFALGNPDLEPSQEIIEDMKALVSQPDIHKYMANAGHADVRQKVADFMKSKTDVAFEAKHIIMCTGAAAGLTITMNSILNPGDEVIVIAPFFGEYRSYVTQYGGVIVPVRSLPDTFQLNVEAIGNAITEKTKAIIINSPNNPSGAVYPEEDLLRLNSVLLGAEAKFGQPIYVISDEPYVKVSYDGVVIPEIAAIFDNAIIVNSFSKSLSLPGERIGYVAVNPLIKDSDILVDALIYSNRTLGFVNAPSLFQKLVADHLDDVVGLDSYKERRDVFYKILTDIGYECTLPKGAFYLFVKSPIEDDGAFCDMALKHNIVIVSGKGFGYPGYFRIAYCVSMSQITGSKEAFKALYNEATGK